MFYDYLLLVRVSFRVRVRFRVLGDRVTVSVKVRVRFSVTVKVRDNVRVGIEIGAVGLCPQHS